MDLRTALDGFYLAIAAEKLSPKTQSDYREHLERFFHFTGNLAIRRLTRESIDKFTLEEGGREVRGHPQRPASVAKAHSVVRRFCRWLWHQELIPKDIGSLSHAPRLPEELPDALTAEEVDRLLASMRGHPRNLTIIRFFLDTGCRLNEVVQLDLKSVDLEQGFAMVMGKGQREGIVAFGFEVRKDLHRYIHRVRKAIPGETALFTNDEGRRLGREGMSVMIKRAFRAVGLLGGAHRLRHTYATFFLRNGGSIVHLQRLLRHRSITVTQRYLHLVDDDLLTAQGRYSPMDRR